jgi:hypothetical protein
MEMRVRARRMGMARTPIVGGLFGSRLEVGERMKVGKTGGVEIEMKIFTPQWGDGAMEKKMAFQIPDRLIPKTLDEGS